MSTPSQFVFSKRHYDLIVKQALDNLPRESGGFLGGKNGTVLAVMPTYNQHSGNQTDTFGITSDDIQRAYEFFARNNVDYFGVYHSHPKGIAYPSKEDIQTGQHFHFIISLRNPKEPVLAAWEIINNEPHQVPIKIEQDSKYSVKDLQTTGKKPTISKPIDPLMESVQQIGEVWDQWRQGQSPQYPKMDPKSRDSDFSTLA